jgi:hypothetical protein
VLSFVKSKPSRIYCRSLLVIDVAAAVGVGEVGAGFVNVVLSHGHPVDGLIVPSGHYTVVSVAY